MTHLGLFEGIGMFSYAAKKCGWETLAWCEWNKFGQKVLRNHFPDAEEFGDITQSDFTKYANRIDVLTGGFPCTDASIANQSDSEKGIRGQRTGLIWEMLRAIREIKPRYVVAENVANILKTNNGEDFYVILSELAGMGYNAEWRVCYASEEGSPHRRARLYLVAYSNNIRLQANETFIPYVQKKNAPRAWMPFGTIIQIFRASSWNNEPPIPLLDDGHSVRVDAEEIKAIGNAVVWQIPFKIFKAIQEYELLHSG